MERNLFAVYERTNSYDRRLGSIVAQNKLRITEADVNAVKCLREDRNRLLQLIDTIRKMRETQKIRDKAQRAGVSKAQGLDEATQRAAQLEATVDRAVEEALAELD